MCDEHSPREAAEVDPAQRIALMTAYEAIEQAGLVPDATPSTRRDRVGVFYGVTSNDWMETNSAQQISEFKQAFHERSHPPMLIIQAPTSFPVATELSSQVVSTTFSNSAAHPMRSILHAPQA